jgi:histidinol phosphatase-like PHP family hydrolase
VEEIAKYCDEQSVEELAVTEHVWRHLNYDFALLLEDIKRANEMFKVRILSGIEAKILPDGTLDCPDDIKEKVDIIIGSVHNLNGMTTSEAYEKLSESDCMIIGHPQFFNDKTIDSMMRTGKIVELSNRYEQPEEMIKAFKDAGLPFSIGLDSHNLEELNNFTKLSRLIEKIGLEERLWRFSQSRKIIPS